MADSKLDREFLRSILQLAAKPAVDHLLMVADVPLSKDDLRGRPLKRKIIYAVPSEQLSINRFQGISEGERNVLAPSIREALKNVAVLDGAFVIREDGVVLAAGRYLQGGAKVELPLGLGARHAAAAAVTVETNAVAISVSQGSGTARVFKGGQAVLELQQVARRSCARRGGCAGAGRGVRDGGGGGGSV